MVCFLSIAKALLLGLLTAQVLATIQVYISNLEYYTFLKAVEDAGYLAVPNENVFSTLRDFAPAFSGGLFFTLTIGAALTLISSAFAWAWDRLFSRKRIGLLFLSLLLLLCLAAANMQGFSPLITGYLLLIPVPVFRFTLKGLPEPPRNPSYVNVIYPLAALLAPLFLLLLWRPSIVSTNRFLDVRDHLLLSNAIGRKLNAFYYENSLYSTRVFESPRQQVIKGCSLSDLSDESLRRRLARALLSQDYLPLGNKVQTDLTIIPSGDDLFIHHHGQLLLKPSISEFLRNPRGVLGQYEARTAKHAFLMGFTALSLVLLAPLLFVGLTYAPFHLLSGLFWKSTLIPIKAGILWSLTMLAILFAFGRSYPESMNDPGSLSEAMASERLQTRIAALKHILRNEVAIDRFPAYKGMLNSPHIAERYWMAKALGKSRTRDTHKALYQLLEDSQFNVVCMALDSLGQRGNRADIPALLNKIETSRNWYEQWYAYRALRRLGWRQPEPQSEATGVQFNPGARDTSEPKEAPTRVRIVS
jgi:hypothetical protein